jgi:hypothetical protein
MSAGLYLRLRGGTYHCRIRVPANLRSFLNRRDVVISLHTGRFESASRKARAIKCGLDQIMTAVEQGMSQAEIERKVREWVAQLALGYDRELALNDGMTGFFTAKERSKMGLEQSRELDKFTRFIIENEQRKAAEVLSKVVAGIATGPSPLCSSQASIRERTKTGRSSAAASLETCNL